MAQTASEKRRVLMVGASSGIGAAIDRAFLAEDDLVTITGAGQAEVDAGELR